MKTLRILFVLAFVSVSFTLIGQLDSLYNEGKNIVDAIRSIESITDLLTLEVGITAFLTTVLGYLTPFIPGIRKFITSTTWRVLIIAGLSLATLVHFGFAESWEAVFGFLFSNYLYKLILSRFSLTRTQKPAA